MQKKIVILNDITEYDKNSIKIKTIVIIAILIN